MAPLLCLNDLWHLAIILDNLTDIIQLTVTAFTMLRGFLGVKWFSVIGTAYNLTDPLFST